MTLIQPHGEASTEERSPALTPTTIDVKAYPILYVDDDKPNREVFPLGEARGLAVDTAPSGEEALQMLSKKRYAVLVTDMRMDGMDGIALCERARIDYPRMRRVLVTAFADKDSAIEAINRAGLSYYFAKPVQPHSLRLALQELIKAIHYERHIENLQQAMLVRERVATLNLSRAGILHDLANMATTFAACTTNFEFMKKELHEHLGDGKLYEEFEHTLDQLTRAVDHAQALHRRGHADTQSQHADIGRHDIGDIIEGVEMLLRRQASGGIHLDLRVPKGLRVLADRIDVSRILLNLTTNACQALREASTPEPQVRVSAWGSGDKVHIRVQDNGPGVPEEERATIFEAFHSSRLDRGGEGLGLAICRSLAQSNQGELCLADAPAESGSLGGAIFELTLPRAL